MHRIYFDQIYSLPYLQFFPYLLSGSCLYIGVGMTIGNFSGATFLKKTGSLLHPSQQLSIANNSSDECWNSRGLSFSMLEFGLAWSYASLVHEVTAAMSSCECHLCHVQKLLFCCWCPLPLTLTIFHFFFCYNTWTLLGENMA